MICKVVIPYTYEPDAFRELGRILRAGARIYFAYHGVGCYLRYVVTGDSRHRVYGLRTLGLRLLENRESRRFLGCPVFIYHTVEKVA